MRLVARFAVSFGIAFLVSGTIAVLLLAIASSKLENEVRMAARWATQLHIEENSRFAASAVEEYTQLLDRSQPSDMKDLLSLQFEGYAIAVRAGDATTARGLFDGAKSTCGLTGINNCEDLLSDLKTSCMPALKGQ